MALITSSTPRHTKTILSTLDGVGALLSILCAIHCLILPFLVGLIPFLQFLNQKNHDVHFILAGLVLPIGAWAFLRGYRYHHRPLLTIIGCSGLVILSLGTFIEPYYFSQGPCFLNAAFHRLRVNLFS